jgi:hypothetical protein
MTTFANPGTVDPPTADTLLAFETNVPDALADDPTVDWDCVCVKPIVERLATTPPTLVLEMADADTELRRAAIPLVVAADAADAAAEPERASTADPEADVEVAALAPTLPVAARKPARSTPDTP